MLVHKVQYYMLCSRPHYKHIHRREDKIVEGKVYYLLLSNLSGQVLVLASWLFDFGDLLSGHSMMISGFEDLLSASSANRSASSENRFESYNLLCFRSAMFEAGFFHSSGS
jgi:hypothetical protein